MISDRQRVQLGAFLHDIGKFWQRTGEPCDVDFAREEVGAHGAHAKWTAAFFSRYVPEAFRAAGSIALYHHRPNDKLSTIIAIADRLSAAEREDAPEGNPRQLLSPFCNIWLPKGKERDETGPAVAPLYYRLSPLAIDEDTIFPVPALPQADKAYIALWQDFVREHLKLPYGDFDAYFESLYHLLLKYTWCVPSAFYRDVPDISLFDHSRTTAAYAVALHQQGLADAELAALLSGSSEIRQQPIFALIGGDVSGIQRFLYTITAQGAAKGLRGRSFYLQLLNEMIARWTLARLGLPLCNMLYCGGGRFYILAPAQAKEHLPALRRELSATLAEAHRGELYVALAAVELSAAAANPQGDTGVDFGQVWRSVGEALDEAKRRKFSELLPNELFSKVFSPRGKGGAAGNCIVCRAEIGRERAGGEGKCALCESFEELGQQLRGAKYLLIKPVGSKREGLQTWRTTLADLGFDCTIQADESGLAAALRDVERATVVLLGDTNFSAAAVAAPATIRNKLSLGFSLHTQVTPHTAEGEIADFNTLADGSQGIKQLGVLRIDVDDLGKIFAFGFGRRSTSSRLAALSLLLRVFFEGWVSKLCADINSRAGGKDQDKSRGQVYPIYSGGDDLLIVGSWSAIPELAANIRKGFARFVAHNPDVHLSAGIALAPKKFPLYQAAEQAREALDERAKHRRVKGQVVKDAIDFLGQTVSWTDFSRAQETTETLERVIYDMKAPRALIHTLGAIHEEYMRQAGSAGEREEDSKVVFGRWMWLAAYSLTRMATRHKDVANEIKQIQDGLLDGKGISLAGLAARWAELLLREGGTSDER